MRTLVAIVMLLLALPLSAQEAPAWSFGVAPQFEQRKLFAAWKPILDELEKRTGEHFRFVSTSSVPQFEQGVARGDYDFVYVNPYHVYAGRSRQGYIPLVRDTAPLRGLVVVRVDSPVRNIRDLDGKSLAVPSPNAVGASMIVRAELERMHGVRVTLVNARSHSSSYLHVINRLADAGGGVEKTLAEQSGEVRDQLRVVYRTGDFPSHPVAAHPRVPAAQRDRVRKALLELSASPDGKRLLAGIPMQEAVSASFADYEVFRKLNLDAYWIEPVRGDKP